MKIRIRKPKGIKLSNPLRNKWFFPLALFIFQLLSALYGEKLPENGGFGWDGMAYASLAQDGIKSWWANDFFIFRLFPSLLVNVAFKLFHISNSAPHIVLAFGILNAVSVSIAAIFMRRIFDALQLRPAIRNLGLMLLFINCGILHFIKYYPVMTDAVGLCLGTIILYCYLKNHSIELIIAALFGAFTTPLIAIIALPLLLFPYKKMEYEALPPIKTKLLSLAGFLYFIGISVYVTYVVKYWLNIPMVLQPKAALLPVGILASALVFAGLVRLFSNRLFFQFSWIKAQFSRWGIITLLIFLGLVALCKFLIPSNGASPYPASFFFFSHHTTCTYMRPLIGLSGQLNFFGSLSLLCIIFWKSIYTKIHQLGLGFTLSLAGVMLLFGQTCEARTLYAIMPMLALALLVAINDYQFHTFFYILVLAINLLTSKVWLTINYQWGNGWDETGAANFPNQWFFMHLGPWMSEKVWLSLLIMALVFTALLFLFSRKAKSPSPIAQ